MKKALVIAVAVLVALSLSMVAFAGDQIRVKGTVIKVDTAAKTVTIKAKDGVETTVIVEDADMINNVKEGGKGEARYTVTDGKNIAVKLRRLTEGCS